jgi:hypothetical protein
VLVITVIGMRDRAARVDLPSPVPPSSFPHSVA